MALPRNAKLKTRSQELRTNATKEERHLWYDYLCSRPERWRRQVVISHFIVDFYCAQAKLVIELDGSQHYTEQGKQYDRERSEILEKYGISVLRFSNSEVSRSFSAVCSQIYEVTMQRISKTESTDESSNNA